MTRLLEWLVRRMGGMTLVILGLLSFCLAGLIWGLSTIVRGLDLDLLLVVTIVGAVSGWLLARSRVHPLLALLCAILIALVAAFVRVGQLGGRLLALMGAAAETLWDAQFRRFYPQKVLEPLESLFGAILTLVTRLQGWSQGLVSGQSVYEPVALALLWSFVVCLVAAWAAWRIRRAERAFDAVLPLVFLLALVTAYAGRDILILCLVLGAWFGLLVAVPHLARERRWEKDAVPFAEGLGFDLALIAVPVIVVTLTLAVVVPVVSPQEIARWVRPLNESAPTSSEVILNSFGIEPAPRPSTALDRTSSPGLPRSHLLGAGPELLERLALSVQIDAESYELPVPYWLGTTYDQYTGHGWLSSSFRVQDYRAGERVSNELLPPDRLFRQSVRVENASGLVYAAGTLESVDQAFQVAWRQSGDMFGGQVNSDSYRVESFVPLFDADVLRAAGEDYPAWVRTEYMHVPDNMPARVLGLARDLTATEATPYDRARAIELYLRTIPYSLDVPIPPAEHDVVDYFLFDLRRGYCDYYATAMAMLARAAGLPARVAVGYAAGDYDPATRTYRVTEAAAHSWTQVYFPNYGWVDFEPTSGRVLVEHDTSSPYAQARPDFQTDYTAPVLSSASQMFEQNWLIIPTFILLVGVAVPGCLLLDTLILRRSEPTRMIYILYQRLIYLARFIGLSMTPGMTPNQLGALLQDSFAAPEGSRVVWLWQPIPSAIHSIVAPYVQTTYGAQELSESEAAGVIRNWQASRLQLVVATLLIVLQAKRNAIVGVSARRIGKSQS